MKNATGKLVTQQVIPISEESITVQFTIDPASLEISKGMYMIRLANENHTVTEKLILH